MKKLLCIFLIVIFLVSLQAQLIFAQSSDAGRMASPAYYYTGDMRQMEQLKIEVQIWGHVRSPGLYIVPDNIDLLSLISLAGGPTQNARLSEVKLIRSNPDTVYVVNVKRFTDTGNIELIPGLKPNDTIMVPGSAFHAFSRVVQFISQIATIATAYVAVARIND